MFARIGRSWRLVKASASVLKQDTELLLFPMISMFALMLVVASFALPVFGLGMLGDRMGEDGLSAAMYVVAFLFYFSQYFVIFFFNSALVGAAMIRLEGGDPTFADGMRIATSRIWAIAGYALIAATVGMILRAIQERVGFIGRIIVAIIGAGWTIATFMVVPVLVSRQVGPVDAIKESAGLLKKTWGENVIGQAGIGLAFAFIFFAVIVAGIVIVFAAFASGSVAASLIALVVVGLAIATTALVQAALSGIYSAALYRYATKGEGTPGFDNQALKLAFAPK
ncbi:MAG TPA: DUF6159 family protein [Usitatibacter sp.]|nr:DUF6159 family protein [Usitatibacter sp.]